MDAITRVPSAIEHGDPHAAEQLLPLVYDELRKMAVERMALEKPGQTLQATALVHEAYRRLADEDQARRRDSPGHFFAAAAMRCILVDYSRRKNCLKRKGDQQRVAFEAAVDAIASPVHDRVALDDALGVLGRQDSTSQVVNLKYFADHSIPESSGVLGIPPRTVDRHRTYARARLHQELLGDGVPGFADAIAFLRSGRRNRFRRHRSRFDRIARRVAWERIATPSREPSRSPSPTRARPRSIRLPWNREYSIPGSPLRRPE
jgi:RNA polymerase sigma factor (TIGR02999 family)